MARLLYGPLLNPTGVAKIGAAGPLPASFVATTLQTFEMPLVSPRTVIGLAGFVAVFTLPGDEHEAVAALTALVESGFGEEPGCDA